MMGDGAGRPAFKEGHKFAMAFTTTSSTTLTALTVEAETLLEKAKRYRAEMESLPPNDERREVYEKLIRELLSASQTISANVSVSVSSS